MGAVIAAIAVGAVGLAAVFVGLVAFPRATKGIGRHADRVSASDPALAAELRHVQAQIDSGRSGHCL